MERGKRNLTRYVFNIAGGFAVVGVSFFGTLLFFKLFPDARERDAVRMEHVYTIKKALERYRVAHGTYPFPFLGNSAADLKATLVDGGYLAAIPKDPKWTDVDHQYGYVSINGKTYGLRIFLEGGGAGPSGAPCLTGIGTAGTLWWAQPPDCPF